MLSVIVCISRTLPQMYSVCNPDSPITGAIIRLGKKIVTSVLNVLHIQINRFAWNFIITWMSWRGSLSCILKLIYMTVYYAGHRTPGGQLCFTATVQNSNPAVLTLSALLSMQIAVLTRGGALYHVTISPSIV